MPRGGHKRMRPRRRRSHSSLANSSSCRHRTRSVSCGRVSPPSLSLQQEPPAEGDQPEDKQHSYTGERMREGMAGRSGRDFFPLKNEPTSAARAQVQQHPVGTRHNATATATSTLGCAGFAGSVSPSRNPARSAPSSERLSRVSLSDEERPADPCAPRVVSTVAAAVASPAAHAAVPPAPAVSALPKFCSTRGAAVAAGAAFPRTLLAAASVAAPSEGPAVQAPASAAVAPAAQPGAPPQLARGIKAAAAAEPTAISATAPAAGQGHTGAAGPAAQIPMEESKECVRSASDRTESSCMSKLLGENLVQIHSRKSSLLSYYAADRDPAAADSAAAVSSGAAAGAPASATTAANASATSASDVSVTGRPVRAGDASFSAEMRPSSASGAVAGTASDAAARTVAAAAEDAAAVYGHSTETPLLRFVEAGGAVRARPRQRPAAASEGQQQQRMLQFVAASAGPRPSLAAARAAESSLSQRFPCSKGVVPGAADSGSKVDTEGNSSSGFHLHALCVSSPSLSFPSSSPSAGDCVSVPARDPLGRPAAVCSVAVSPAAVACGVAGGVASAAAPATDASATACCILGASAPSNFSEKTMRHSEQLLDASDASVSLLLRDIADAAAHSVLLPVQHQQPPAQRSRRLPVLKIAGGSCERLLLQTPELLKLVHSHNPRGVLEDAADGALKLRDLRQVVGRRTMQRPSVEVRRNCVLVNLPFVRAILLHGCVVLLPPADFSCGGYSPFAQLKKKQQQQQSVQRAEQQVFWGSRRHQEGSRDHPREQAPARPSRQWLHAVSEQPLEGVQQQSAWAPQEQHPHWKQQLVDMDEEQLEAEEREQRGGQQPQGGGLTWVGGQDGREPARTLFEEDGISNSRGRMNICKNIWQFFCRTRQGSRYGWRGGAGLRSSSDGSNGYSDYTFLWGGEAAPLDARNLPNGYRGLPLCDLRGRSRHHNPFYGAQRKEQERSNSEAASLSPPSILENWVEGVEGSGNSENQHRLILKLLRITAVAKLEGTAASTPEQAIKASAALSGPAECAALEAILEHVCDGLTAELEPIAEAAANVLRVIHEQPSSTRKLRKVGDLRRRLDSIKSEARGADDALRSLLDSEDHLRRLEVSRFWGGENVSAEWLRPSRSANSEDIEILLESYEQELDALLKGIVRTEEALDDALQLMELHLASIRNAFLKSEIALDVVGVLFGGIAAFAGVFGMNIKSGWEDKQNTFWILAGSLCFLSCVTCCLVYVWFRRQKL